VLETGGVERPAARMREPLSLCQIELASSESVFCSRITMSGTDGSSTVPCDNSSASPLTNENTTVLGSARVSTVESVVIVVVDTVASALMS